MVRANKKKYLQIIIIISFIILLFFLIVYIKYKKNNNNENFNINNFEENIENAINPYIKSDTNTNTNTNKDIIWQKLDTEFMKNNWPNTFDFDYPIKEDIIKHAITLPQNSCIIDCGSHIGDGSIPIAHALKYHNREDIIVYAIDPSKFKCNFIEFIKQKNNLNNLIVLNYGLSNVNSKYKTSMQSGNNTGAWQWSISDSDGNDDYNINTFIKLDDLIKNNIIKHIIGIIHFDLEGMEKEALEGGLETIEKYKPYMSIENNNVHRSNNDYFLEFLPKGYKYAYNKADNNILIFDK